MKYLVTFFNISIRADCRPRFSELLCSVQAAATVQEDNTGGCASPPTRLLTDSPSRPPTKTHRHPPRFLCESRCYVILECWWAMALCGEVALMDGLRSDEDGWTEDGSDEPLAPMKAADLPAFCLNSAFRNSTYTALCFILQSVQVRTYAFAVRFDLCVLLRNYHANESSSQLPIFPSSTSTQHDYFQAEQAHHIREPLQGCVLTAHQIPA